jgi:hypothetical protein
MTTPIGTLVNIYLATLDQVRPSPISLTKMLKKLEPNIKPTKVYLGWTLVTERLRKV